MVAFRTAIKDFELANPLYAGAVVTFYTVDEDGEQTATLATLYAGATGATQAANPQTLDGDGKFERAVYISDPVIAEVVGIGISSQVTGIIAPAPTYRGAWEDGQRYYANDTLSDPDALYTLYVATQNFVAGEGGNDFDDDVGDGYVELVAKGGDTAYFVVDDAGKPGSGEIWRMLVSEALTLPAGAAGSYAKALAASTGSAVLNITNAAGSVKGTITFTASATAVIAAAAEYTFAAGDEIRIVAPDPQNATLSDIAVTLRLSRTPAS